MNYNDLVQGDRVHGSIYTDPDIFEQELDRIFHRGWVFVGHEAEIPENGDFRTRTLGRQPVIFVRGEDGAIRVLMNRCTHRGTAVCVQERGNVREFVCAYHGWRFRNTGRLTGVPHPNRYDSSFPKDALGLRPVPRLGSYRGLWFACLTSEGPSLDEHLGSMVKAEIDFMVSMSPSSQLSMNGGVHKYNYGGNWKLQLENSVDGYHIDYLHRSFFDIMEARTGVNGRKDYTGSAPSVVKSLGNGHVLWDTKPQFKASTGKLPSDPRPEFNVYYGQMVAAHGPERAHYLLSRRNAHLAVFPNLVIIAAQLRVIQPISVSETQISLYPTMLKDVPAEINRQRMQFHEAFYGPAGGGATDDFEVFERITLGLRAQIDPWILISRGAGKEYVDEDGAIVGQITDELSSRAILQHWQRTMMAGGGTTSSYAAGIKLPVGLNA